MQRFVYKWKQYRYRFLPWLLLNLKDRSVRAVTKNDTDALVSETWFNDYLWKFFSTLHTALSNEDAHLMTPAEKYKQGLHVLRECSGFCLERTKSILPSGGRGVCVTKGMIPRHHVTSIYPGLLYQPHDPVFFQSIGNPFIFRCIDGVLVDGNDKGLSKSLFKSCLGRDSCWPLPACDETWLTDTPVCPLNVGQYVNNHTKRYPANVAYQEFTLPSDFPVHLKQYLPINHYSSILDVPDNMYRPTKIVALVSLDEIPSGHELFSSYFTMVT
ncbi:SET domain-containing protein 9 [Plakobranchus ocellatus]|uniref:SET domain-containing protein 9 n=1 Tax=Plakobranchus ocellatus TaxID=259542 RepID=A0AAV4C4Q2_9GAST|nr:SET domain-containing protein 9 [Plakobranchus ocellatus]